MSKVWSYESFWSAFLQKVWRGAGAGCPLSAASSGTTSSKTRPTACGTTTCGTVSTSNACGITCCTARGAAAARH
jgi:hypothetical protein